MKAQLIVRNLVLTACILSAASSATAQSVEAYAEQAIKVIKSSFATAAQISGQEFEDPDMAGFNFDNAEDIIIEIPNHETTSVKIDVDGKTSFNLVFDASKNVVSHDPTLSSFVAPTNTAEEGFLDGNIETIVGGKCEVIIDQAQPQKMTLDCKNIRLLVDEPQDEEPVLYSFAITR
jgi:hypothetical protein